MQTVGTGWSKRIFVPYKYARGGIWLSPVVDYTQQVFSFRADDTGETIHWYVNRLYKVEPKEEITVELLPDQIDFVLRKHGIQADRLTKIPNDRLDEHGLMVHFDDGSDVFVDGNHRYVRRFQLGRRYMNFWLLTREQAKVAELDLPHLPNLFK